jgi:tetratricopeptide (TPR) repeat protein
LLDIGYNLLNQYEQSRDLRDINRGIESTQAAHSLIQADRALMPDCLAIWASLLGHLFTRTGEQHVVDEAIEKIQLAIRARPNELQYLQNFGVLLGHRCMFFGDEKDLDKAIEISHKVVHLSREVLSLNNLSTLLGRRYARTKDIEDLNIGIGYAREAEKLSRGGEHEATCLGTLGDLLGDFFTETRDPDTLEEAIQKSKDAESISKGHPDQPKWLNNLGHVLEKRFERKGIRKDLDEAILMTQKAIGMTHTDDFDLPRRLNNLGNQLERRYELTGDTESLDQAIRNMQAARKLMKHADEFPGILDNLAYLLDLRFKRTKDPDDIDKAIEVSRLSNKPIPDNSSDRAMHLNMLGNVLRNRFNENPQLSDDISEAIEHGEEALKSTLKSHPNLASWAANLALSLISQYGKSNDPQDLEKAIARCQWAVDLTPPDLPDNAACLSNLGNMLLLHDAVLTDQVDRDSYSSQALDCYIRAYNCEQGIPLIRIKAARQAARILLVHEDRAQAMYLGRSALELHPLVCGRYLIREDQQHAIIETSGLAADVCSLSLMNGHVEKALQELEFGRGLILRYMIDAMSDITTLRAEFPQLSECYDTLQHTISLPIDTKRRGTQENWLKERREAISEIDECLREIRQKDGYEGFLLQPGIDELKACADEGPIVVVNVTDISSDAIIVSKDKITSIPLPAILAENAPFSVQQDIRMYKYRSADENCWRLRDMESEEIMSKHDSGFLEWLYLSCVAGVLKELKSSSIIPASRLPRIWWIGTGVASSYPFHAAGLYHQGYQETSLSRMIASYTPTIKALAYSRAQVQKNAQLVRRTPSVLCITMPRTPGQNQLDGVEDESLAVEETCKGTYTFTALNSPSVDTVIQSLGTSDIVHFACHGASDLTNPSNSRLLLQKNGPSGPVVDDLTVSRILDSQKLGRAWIAYLSACSTAEVKVRDLADEGLHIGSAFQLAGFAHVIGSLWSVDDKVCIEVAKHFYERLTTYDLNGLSNRAVAEALHSAIVRVRSVVLCSSIRGFHQLDYLIGEFLI